MSFGQLKGSLVGGNNSIPNPLPATGSVVVAVGDLIVALIAQQTANTSTGCGDNLHGASTYTAQNAGTLSTISGRLWFKVVTTPGTLTTVNFVTTSSANDASCCAAVFSGPFVASPLDATPTNLTADTTTPYSCPASGTLAQAVELVVGWLAATANVTYAAGTGYTISATQAQSANASSAICHQIVATTGTTTPSFTGTAPSSDVLGTASFKADLTFPVSKAGETTGVRTALTPSGPQYPVGLRTWLQSTVASMPTPDATYMPSRVSEWGTWEDQRKPLTHIDFAIALRPQGTPPPPPDTTHIPGRVTDWGTWERIPFIAAPLTNLTLSLPSVAVTYIFREPYYSPKWVGPRFETWTTAVNIALRQVAPPLRPFKQTDWPLTPAARQPDRTFQRAFPPELVGQDRLPIRQQDWKLPVIADYSVSLRSFLARPGLPLISAPVVQPPFSQDDWPVPIARYYDISLRTFIAINPPLLATSPPPPILMPPLIIEWGISDRIPFQPASIQYNAPLLTAPVPARPFKQTDWPLTAAPPQPDRTFQRAFPPELIGQDRLPFRQQSWPVPISADYSVSLRSFLASPSLPLITVTVTVVLPFNQDDWPVPPALRQPDRTFQRAFPPTLVGQDQLPVRQNSWPVPIATEFSNALRSIGFRSPALDVAAGRPFVQSNWPLTPAASQPDRTFQRSFPRALIGKDRLPIRQQDWPLPIAPRPASDLRTYIAQSPIRLIGKDRLPFRQMHWPVPLAPLEFHTLRSITQGRVIYGGEQVPIPPEPEPPPPEVIHSVRAHADAYYGVFYADEIKGRADFSRAKGSNDEEAAN